MWLTQRLSREEGARVTSAQVSGGGDFSVQGENAAQTPETLFPYGFSSRAEQGSKAVLLDGYCAGVSRLPDSSLQEGEVRLYSVGGAEILLKRNGDVIINGQIFARPQEGST